MACLTPKAYGAIGGINGRRLVATVGVHLSRQVSVSSRRFARPSSISPGACSSSCFFQAVIWLVWTPNSLANWAAVLSPRAAANATLALNAGPNTRRFLVVLDSSWSAAPSGGNYTLSGCRVFWGPPQAASSLSRQLSNRQNGILVPSPKDAHVDCSGCLMKEERPSPNRVYRDYASHHLCLPSDSESTSSTIQFPNRHALPWRPTVAFILCMPGCQSSSGPIGYQAIR